MRRQTAAIAATTLLAAGVLTGCSDDADELLPRGETATDNPEFPGGHGPAESESDDGEPQETETGGAEVAYPETADLREVELPISANDAVEIAGDDAGAGFLYSIELDYSDSDSAWVYEVKILDGTTKHEVEIDAVSGDVLDSETDSTDDEEQEITLGDPMEISEALELATNEVNEPLRGWKYEHDDGRLTYEFDFGPPRDTVEIGVDAETGETFRG